MSDVFFSIIETCSKGVLLTTVCVWTDVFIVHLQRWHFGIACVEIFICAFDRGAADTVV